MKKIKLFDRSEEIFNELPKDYAEIILNSIIARSVQNGNLFSEVELFLNSEEFLSFKNKFKKKIPTKISAVDIEKRNTSEIKVEKRITKKEKEIEDGAKAFTL
jgi:hypothetical protein